MSSQSQGQGRGRSRQRRPAGQPRASYRGDSLLQYGARQLAQSTMEVGNPVGNYYEDVGADGGDEAMLMHPIFHLHMINLVE